MQTKRLISAVHVRHVQVQLDKILNMPYLSSEERKRIANSIKKDINAIQNMITE